MFAAGLMLLIAAVDGKALGLMHRLRKISKAKDLHHSQDVISQE